MTVTRSVISDDLLEACGSRAGTYDRENVFFAEDLVALKAAGYLTMAVPTKFGGRGLGISDACAETRRLAYRAPATAIALNMHIFYTGTAADLQQQGDPSLEFVLEESAKGEVFAAGISEPGNDLPGFNSITKAKRVEGGYQFTGRKIFTSLSPVWSRLVVDALDPDHPDGPSVIWGVVTRDSNGVQIGEDWDVLGMRATQSHSTKLEETFIPDASIFHVVPQLQADPFLVASFTWFTLGIANVYIGIAERMFDLALHEVKSKSTAGLEGPLSHHPFVQRQAAEMYTDLSAAKALTDSVCSDWENGGGADPQWFARIFSTKHHAVESAWRVADSAMELVGGAGMFRGNEIERLFRDARCGRFHPPNPYLAHEMVAKILLGVDLVGSPRWA